MNRMCTLFVFVLLFSTMKRSIAFDRNNGIEEGGNDEDENFLLFWKIVERFNTELRSRNLDEFAARNKLIEFLGGSLEIRQARVGNFSSLAFRGDRQDIEKSYPDAATVYDFDLLLEPRALAAVVDFDLDLGPIYYGSGSIKASVDGASLRTRGSVTLNGVEPGSCESYLDSAQVVDPGDITVLAKPETTFLSVLVFLAKNIMYYTSSFAVSYLNAQISTYLKTEDFQSTFRNIICSCVVHEIKST